ncbi:MAG: hypothetical protein JSW26_00235 [Desulfobacterales bacterium]|nr:MAG: hypothetical protein JSW26_00235 [Desulfobacterales bacterium]
MPATNNFNLSHNNNGLWIISEGRFSDIDLSRVVDGHVDGPHKEYKISDIGRYLLNPRAIEVKKKMIGGEIHYKQGGLKKIRRALRKTLPTRSKDPKKNSGLSPEVIVSRFKLRIPAMQDPDLESYLNRIYDQLKTYDSFAKRLAQLDPDSILQIVGICEDVGGNYSYLKLQGSIDEKIKYLNNFISKDVGVILNKAYISEGLFELRGYDFRSYSPAKSYRLFSYNSGGEQKACVLTGHNKVEFYLNDYHLIKYMHLFEQALRVDPGLYEALGRCLEGQVQPIKLFFDKKLEIDYAKSPLPAIYQDVFQTLNVTLNQRNLIKPILNYLQIGVSLNYMFADDLRDDRMFTHISVLHDCRALEPLRKNLPKVFTTVLKHAFASEAGRYYLLDSINGFNDAEQ